MKSGLEGRNNHSLTAHSQAGVETVSMKSGLEGRNNLAQRPVGDCHNAAVSMKSGLEGRNNHVNNMNAGLASDMSQ